MTPDALTHRLTEAEQLHFEEQGHLHIENALTEEQVDGLKAAVDKLHGDAIEAGITEEGKPWGKADLIGQDDAFLDIPRVLPKIWDILGWNIYRHIHMHGFKKGQDHHPPLVEGDEIQWVELFAKLREIGYAGVLNFEPRGEPSHSNSVEYAGQAPERIVELAAGGD